MLGPLSNALFNRSINQAANQHPLRLHVARAYQRFNLKQKKPDCQTQIPVPSRQCVRLELVHANLSRSMSLKLFKHGRRTEFTTISQAGSNQSLTLKVNPSASPGNQRVRLHVVHAYQGRLVHSRQLPCFHGTDSQAQAESGANGHCNGGQVTGGDAGIRQSEIHHLLGIEVCLSTEAMNRMSKAPWQCSSEESQAGYQPRRQRSRRRVQDPGAGRYKQSPPFVGRRRVVTLFSTCIFRGSCEHVQEGTRFLERVQSCSNLVLGVVVGLLLLGEIVENLRDA
jgi:hypothetical protein